MRWVACAAGGCVLALLLAGCSDGAGNGAALDEVVVESSKPVEVGGAPPAPADVDEDEVGHIAGVVVDPAVRPLEGAVVRLVTLDVEDAAERDGAFAFTDLRPGSYQVEATFAGHHAARTVLDVRAGEFTRVRFVLEPIPPPEPYHQSWHHRGHMQAWAFAAQYLVEDIMPNGSPLCNCRFDVRPDPNVTAFVFEATYQPSVPSPQGSLGDYYWWLYEERYTSRHGLDVNGYCANPCHEFVDAAEHGYTDGVVTARLDGPDFWFTANQSFDMAVTAWYNGQPPVGWSVRDG